MREQQSSEERLSAIGVGVAVGSGAIIGFSIVVPHLTAYALLMGFVTYTLLSALVFKVWQMALEGLTLFPRR